MGEIQPFVSLRSIMRTIVEWCWDYIIDWINGIRVVDMEKGQKGVKQNALYADLDKFMGSADYDRAIKICNKLIHQVPDDEVAFRCKIVGCIHLGRIDDAMSLMEKTPKLTGNLGFEKAYCYYRNQDMVGAKEVLDRCPDSTGKQELMTQIKYRLEEYDDAYDNCRELIRTAEDEYEEERQTNLAAINACLIASGSKRRLDKVEYDTHELRYNMACALIAEQRYADALKVLTEAEVKANETLKEDGLSEEEILEETAIICIQIAYCLQKLGREKEAMALYSKTIKNKSAAEADLVAVASNNILCMNKDQNIFDSKKRVKAMRAEGADAKLTRAQRRDMNVNQCLFYLLTSQPDLCKETCAFTSSKFPETQRDIFLIQTALIVKTEGIDAAKQFVGKKEANSVELNLCFVQQLLRDGNRKNVSSILEGLVSDSYKPGIVGALVTLYQHEGKLDAAATLMKKAVEFYRKSQGNKKQMNMMWRKAATLLLQQGDVEEAIKSLEVLLKATPEDKTALAQLIVAYSRYDISKAYNLSSQLPPIAQPDDLDMATLESPNWLASVKLMKKAKPESVPSTPQVSNANAEEKKAAKKKRRGKCKSKLPKEFDPERNPDPERWLPKYERAGHRPKKQRRGKDKDVGKGTQGADSATSAMYDMSAKMKSSKRENSIPPSPSSPIVKGSGKGRKSKAK